MILQLKRTFNPPITRTQDEGFWSHCGVQDSVFTWAQLSTEHGYVTSFSLILYANNTLLLMCHPCRNHRYPGISSTVIQPKAHYSARKTELPISPLCSLCSSLIPLLTFRPHTSHEPSSFPTPAPTVTSTSVPSVVLVEVNSRDVEKVRVRYLPLVPCPRAKVEVYRWPVGCSIAAFSMSVSVPCSVGP